VSYVVTSDQGPACPRCGRPTQTREHNSIGAKQSDGGLLLVGDLER
jgi:hypothetical protein